MTKIKGFRIIIILGMLAYQFVTNTHNLLLQLIQSILFLVR